MPLPTTARDTARDRGAVTNVTASGSAPRAMRHIGGLDGLRATAVTLVLVYHLFPDALPGGFLGVDIFFVISGFLITSLLLDERRRTGRIALVSFWRRRARRLLPALGLVLLVSTSAALLVDRLFNTELLVNIGAQVAGSAFFVANWVYIALGADYFARDNPELFRNMWSLAIEEQFYVLLPLVLLAALHMRTKTVRTVFFTLLGLTSAWLMVSLYMQGATPTRVYFGTDTHLFGLFFGVALACAAQARSTHERNTAPTLRWWQQLLLLTVGLISLGGIGWYVFTLREGSSESFLGGFQAATALMVVVVWAATRRGSWFGRALDVAPLRWVGERSYGIYLWHWPLLLIVGGVADHALSGVQATWMVPLTVALLTFSFAALSYRYVEQPIRRLGLTRSLKHLVRPVRLHGRRLAIGLAMIALLVVTLPTTTVAITTAPTESSSAAAIHRGLAVLEQHNAARETRPGGGSDRPARDKTASTAPEDSDAPGTVALGVPDWADTPEYTPPPPEPIESWELYAVGDSVMLASVPELAAAFPEIWVDAAVSRGLAAGVGIVAGLEAEGSLRPVLVVGLGTNGPIDDADLVELKRIAGDRRIVLVNAYADRWWTAEVNRQLLAFADAHRGVVLADWAGAIVQVPDGLAGDEVHPNPSGGVAYAESVQRALDALLEREELPERRGASR